MRQKITGAIYAAILLLSSGLGTLHAQDHASGSAAKLSLALGRPTDRSITLSVLSATKIEAHVEYGTKPGTYTVKTDARIINPVIPVEFELGSLTPNTRYHYRVGTQEGTFHTQRAPGSAFTFALQGDSHPERAGKMFDARLYAQTLRNVVQDAPDFYLTLGDDFSIERLIERQSLDQVAVDQVYARQRDFLG
ncbi:MAG: fibronectin type III domain-containing protein, partial [Verrucomicrobiota bacterium]